ncbi:hypothetical protein Scep_025605 [Stephania cephalantha]|uniref:Uncharacterized protein n=1 Tax=Stephania cephalantha TaxID=152367 RepID=A0AAP0EIJ8_9MAGN
MEEDQLDLVLVPLGVLLIVMEVDGSASGRQRSTVSSSCGGRGGGGGECVHVFWGYG